MKNVSACETGYVGENRVCKVSAPCLQKGPVHENVLVHVKRALCVKTVSAYETRFVHENGSLHGLCA